MDSDEPPNLVHSRTICVYLNLDKYQSNIYKFISSIYRNIYNSSIFCTTIFNKFKYDLYKKIYYDIKKIREVQNNKDNQNSKSISDSVVHSSLDNYYDFYVKHKDAINKNNNFLYKFVIDKLKSYGGVMTNHVFKLLRYDLINFLYFDKNNCLSYNNNNKKYLVFDIYDNILFSIYNKTYNTIKTEMTNNIPFSIKNIPQRFINEIKNNKFITEAEKIDYKSKLIDEFNMELKSDQNYIACFIRRKLGNDQGKLPSDMIADIITEAHEAYTSFYKSRAKGIKSNMPKYLPKNKLVTIGFCNRLITTMINENTKHNTFKLFVGKYVSTNFVDITNNNNLICVKTTKNNRLYIDKEYLLDKTQIKKGTTKEYFKVGEKYAKKSSKHIISGGYQYFKLPPLLKNKYINEIKLKPIHEGYKFKMMIVYSDKKITKQERKDQREIIKQKQKRDLMKNISPEDSISIDLGTYNLMTIYDPTGEQKIIKGDKIVNTNIYYDYKLDKMKSILMKSNKKSESNKMADIRNKKMEYTNNYMNISVKKLEELYSNKKQIIIGYNPEWKTGINLGKKTNRMFYNIPFKKLINKIKDKFEPKGILIRTINESYTSKCDALGLEEIGRHEEYMGRRTKRGLFESSIGKKVNADLNGAINIMRKYYIQRGNPMKIITGEKIYNPTTIKILNKNCCRSTMIRAANRTHEMFQKTNESQANSNLPLGKSA